MGSKETPKPPLSADPSAGQPDPSAGQPQPGAGAGEGPQPSEEEIREQLEQEIKKVRVEDVLMQSLVSILNLTARRIAKDDERDLVQGKLGIDAAAALADMVPEEAKTQIKQAISELQLLYAQYAGGEAAATGGANGGTTPKPASEQAKPDSPPSAPDPPAKPGDSGLWTP